MPAARASHAARASRGWNSAGGGVAVHGFCPARRQQLCVAEAQLPGLPVQCHRRSRRCRRARRLHACGVEEALGALGPVIRRAEAHAQLSSLITRWPLARIDLIIN